MGKLSAVVGLWAGVVSFIFNVQAASTTRNVATSAAPPAWIVTLQRDVDVDGLVKEFALQPRKIYQHALKGFAADLAPATIKALNQDSRVVAVEANGNMILCGQTNGAGIIRMEIANFPVAHINGQDNRIDLDVAVLDTGIDLNHPDLTVVDTQDFSGSGYVGDDWNGHGTLVAGILGALDNGFGVVGVAPGVRLWSVEVIGPNDSSWYNFLAGMDYVAQNAARISIANASLGSDGITAQPYQAIREAVSNVVRLGIVFVTSAGNFAKDVYGPDGVYGTADDFLPAALPEALTVSAMDPQTNQMAGFSNYSNSDAGADKKVTSPGKTIDLAAPGVNILSTYKDQGYAIASGTSMAAPHVAGLVALYIAANGRAHSAEDVYRIRQILVNTAQPQSAWAVSDTHDPDGNFEPLAIANESWIPSPLISAGKKTPGGFQLSFSAVPGYNYTAQYCASLELSNNWTNLSTLTGTGGVATVTILDSTPDASRFYRLLRQPTP